MILTPDDPVQARFMGYVQETDGCWLWTACTDKGGYGKFTFSRKTHSAHRLAYQWWNGPIPAGLSVLHRCNTPSCVNPCHLYAGTHFDNMRDRKLAGRYIGVVDYSKRNTARGPRNGNAKLSEQDAAHIKRSTLPREEIARLYGVTPGAVSHIKTGRTWRHVP